MGLVGKRTIINKALLDISLYREAEEWRDREYNAAIKIQSWFRGCRVRAYLR